MQPLSGSVFNSGVNPLFQCVGAPPGRILSNTSASTELENVYKWIAALRSSENRETALSELCKKRESVAELAPLLWHSCGAIAALLQEICAIYPYLNPPRLTATQSNRVCNALALLQCIASHPSTRTDFLRANIPLYLYTFLNTNNKNRPFEYLRLTSLGVIGALTDEPDVINFLLGSEIIPLCLVIMESGTELSKTVATFIMQKMLLDNCGLAYICQTYQRFAHVATVLEKMVFQLAQEPSLRLLKHVIRCYLRLSDHQKARETLKTCLPTHLSDDTFSSILEQDMATKRWLTQLLRHLQITPAPSTVIDGNPISSSASSVSTVVGSASSTGVAADIVGVRGSTDSMDASGSGGVSITALGNPASSESSDVINNSGSAGNAGQAGPVGSLVICTSSGSGSMSQRLHLSTSASTVTSLASAVSGGSK